jgi:hypothetical protein
MTERRKPRPRDPLQLAKLIGDIATGQTNDTVDDGKDPAAAELGRRGGVRGGRHAQPSLAQNGGQRSPGKRLESERQKGLFRERKS